MMHLNSATQFERDHQRGDKNHRRCNNVGGGENAHREEEHRIARIVGAEYHKFLLHCPFIYDVFRKLCAP